MVIESVTGDSSVTPLVSGEDSGGEEGDGESFELSLSGFGDDELEESEEDDDELEESEEDEGELEESEDADDDDDDDDDGLLPVAGAPSRAAAPSGPVVEK